MAHAPMAFKAMLLSFNGYKLIFCAFKLSPSSFSCVWPTKARPHFETSLLFLDPTSRSQFQLRLNALASASSFFLLLVAYLVDYPILFFFFLGRFQLPNLKNHIFSCFSGTPPSTTETVNQKYECDSSVQISKINT